MDRTGYNSFPSQMQEDFSDFKFEDLRSFGRIRARRRSARQHRLLEEVLSRNLVDVSLLQKVSLSSLFSTVPNDIWLEIGFGGAEHLIEQSKLHPEIGLIGSEPFEGGVLKALSAIEIENIQNIRLHNSDVRPLLRAMPNSSLGRIFILYPDPWPKTRHSKRRLINRDFVNLIERVMKPAAQLRIATDIKSYAQEIFDVCSENSSLVAQPWKEDLLQKPWFDWRGTRYEKKAHREGRVPFYLTFTKVIAR